MPDLTGVILSEYLLLACIGRGSSADVYRARRQEGGTYEVAVKVFHAEYAEDEGMRAAFLCEAEKIGQFDHPHILPLIEYGEGDGLLYAVMPLVKNGTLDDLLKQVGGRLSALQALPIVQQLCDAVHYGHERDVIHGNIKPDNVFLANDGRMLLADFSLVRRRQQVLKQLEWGAVQYAAPEQSLGLLRRAGDIYSLGAVFFRLLTGSPVFVGQTPVEVLLKHVRHVPPSACSLEESISPGVDAVLQKALRKRCDERYTTALELAQAFAESVTSTPLASSIEHTIRPGASPLVPDPQTPLPASLVAIEAQETAPLVPVTALPPVNQTAVISLPATLLQPSQPQPPVLPEQHGLTGLSSAEHVISAPLTPVAWLPWDRTREETGDAPIQAASGQAAAVEPVSGQSVPRRGRLLPVLVVILLLLGLLAALLSSFLLPVSAPRGTGTRVRPAVIVRQVDTFLHHSS